MQLVAGATHGRDTIGEGHGRNTVETQLERDTCQKRDQSVGQTEPAHVLSVQHCNNCTVIREHNVQILHWVASRNIRLGLVSRPITRLVSNTDQQF